MKSDIDFRLKNAILKSVTGRYAVYACQLVSLMVMARIFTPEEFGQYAIVQVFAVFFLLLSEMGIGPALINKSNIDEVSRDTVFRFSLMLGFCVGLFFYCLYPIVNNIYEDDFHHLIFPVAIGVFFTAAAVVPLASMQKEKMFILISFAEVVAELVSLIVIIFLVEINKVVWLLSFKFMVFSFFRFIGLYYFSDKTSVKRAGFNFYEKKEIFDIFSFSKYQAGFHFLNYFSRNLDNILVGKFIGLSALGVYDKAYQLMRYPLLLLTFAMSPAIQPVMRELQGDISRFKEVHDSFVRKMSYLGLVVGVLFYFSSDVIVFIILGDQWEAVIVLLKILALTIPIQIVLSTSGGFYQASGRVDLLFKCGKFSAAVTTISIVVGVFIGSLEAVCWGLVFAFSVNFLQCYHVFYGDVLKSNIKIFLESLQLPMFLWLLFLGCVVWMELY